jgi:hypothetical protein
MSRLQFLPYRHPYLDFMSPAEVEASLRLHELIDEVGFQEESGHLPFEPARAEFIEDLWPGETLKQIWKRASEEESCWFTRQQFIDWWMSGLQRFMGPTVTLNGTLRYALDPLPHAWLEVDPGIVKLARALIPRAQLPDPQRYAPHITVIRNEILPPAHADLGVPDGLNFEFTYDSRLREGDVYWWLRVWSPALTQLRLDLGLRPSSEYSRPPDGEDCFHITVGNKKRTLAP